MVAELGHGLIVELVAPEQSEGLSQMVRRARVARSKGVALDYPPRLVLGLVDRAAMSVRSVVNTTAKLSSSAA